jgi:hypothetical protein
MGVLPVEFRHFLRMMFAGCLSLLSVFLTFAHPATLQNRKADSQERERRAAKEAFNGNFRELQLLGINLLKDHQSGALDKGRLAKDTKAIQKRARSLRGLMVLGEPIEPPIELESKIRTAPQFDKFIGWLSRLIYDFAHNPVHKNTRVFDTEAAGRAAADIINIINLAKLIEQCSGDYTPNTNGEGKDEKQKSGRAVNQKFS